MTEQQSQKPVKHSRQNQTLKKENNKSEDCIFIYRKQNVKKPFISKNVAILYTLNPITIRPRSSFELNMCVKFEYPDHILPECNLLPSFRKYLELHSTVVKEDGETFKLTLLNKSFCDCLRIVKDTGIVYFSILNKNCNIKYVSKYMN